MPRAVRPSAHVGQLALLAFSALALYPLYYMTVTALKTPDQFFSDSAGLPPTPTLASFRAAFADGQFVTWLWNSVQVSGGTVLLTLLVSLPLAFGLARFSFRGKRPTLLLLGALLGVSPAVILVPLFVLFTRLHLVDTIHGAILIYTGLLTPFTTYLLAGFVRQVSSELIDAATVDGATNLGVLRHVVFPLVRPALVTAGIIVVLTVWNDLLFALVFLPSDSNKTVMAALTLFESRALANEPLVMAGTLIATLPMVLVYVVGFRFFERGLMAGAFR